MIYTISAIIWCVACVLFALGIFTLLVYLVWRMK